MTDTLFRVETVAAQSIRLDGLAALKVNTTKVCSFVRFTVNKSVRIRMALLNDTASLADRSIEVAFVLCFSGMLFGAGAGGGCLGFDTDTFCLESIAEFGTPLRVHGLDRVDHKTMGFSTVGCRCHSMECGKERFA